MRRMNFGVEFARSFYLHLGLTNELQFLSIITNVLAPDFSRESEIGRFSQVLARGAQELLSPRRHIRKLLCRDICRAG